MTTPLPSERPPALAALPELVGLLLLMVGVIGLGVVAFLAHPLAGWAYVCTVSAAVGFRLTTDGV